MKNLARLRKQKGLTQGQLAKYLNVELNTIWKWENEKITPSVESAQRTANFFNISIDELLNGPGEETFKVTLKFVKSLEGVNEEMRAEKITLTIDEAGYLGVAGMAPVKTAEDIDTVIREIRFKLEEGVESIRRMAEKRKKIERGE